MQSYACQRKVEKKLPDYKRLRRYLGGRNGNPLQYSCPDNFMDRGAWRATVHGVTKSWTQLSD